MKKIFYLLIVFSLLNFPIQTQAAEANHVVISEIKTSGGSGKTTDEFVELYNPTSADISLNGWQLAKKTSSGSNYVLVENLGDKTIRAHSFLLVAHPTGYLGTTIPDLYYTTTNSISDNNTIVLLDSSQSIVDDVGYGTASIFEGQPAANPVAGKSLERKAHSDATVEMMTEGGVYYFSSNGEDSDNNLNDFVLRDTPEPQNTTSDPEFSDYVAPPFPTNMNTQTPAPTYPSGIIISELFPNPKGADDGEFIELYNTGTAPVDLNGWKLSDATARKFVITTEDFSSTIIPPHGYFVVEKKISAVSLNNTSDAAKLYYPDDAPVNSIEYTGCQEGKSYSLVDGVWLWTDQVTPGAANIRLVKNELPQASFEVTSDVLKVGAKIAFDAADSSDADEDTLGFVWNFGDGTTGSGEKTEHVFKKAGTYTVRLTITDPKGGEDEAEQPILITDYDYSKQLVFNELLPACQGADADCEYIELYNPENRSINLGGWSLSIKNSKYIFPESSTIKAHGYAVLKRQDSKLSLNNSGATVTLIDPRHTIINTIEYEKAKDDLSYSRVSATEWQWSTAQTPGQANKIVADDEDESADTSGDEPEKTGKDLSSVVTPLSEVTEDKLGDVLKVSATIESVSGNNMYLVDEAGNALRAYIQKATGIKKPELKSGDQVQITGILDKTSAGLRLLPRRQNDIVVLAKENGQVLGASTDEESISITSRAAGRSEKTYMFFGIGIFVIFVGMWIIRKRFLAKKTEPIDES